MARLQNIGTSEDWFVGEDKLLSFEIFASNEVTMEDVTGWAIQWVMRRGQGGDAILLNKSTSGSPAITITGVYNSDMNVNTQRVNVPVLDTDTDRFQPGKYNHALKRTDAGNETILSYGAVELKKAAL